MQIKKFEAQNMIEALRLIKREFGPDAVILSVRKTENTNKLFGFSRAAGIEVTAATDAQIKYDKFQGHNRDRSNAREVEEKNGFIKSLCAGSRLINKKNSLYKWRNPKRNIDIKELYSAYCQLLEQDVDPHIALELTREVNRLASSNSCLWNKGFKSCLLQALDEKGISANRVKIVKEKQKLVAVIGSTGVGKTSTIVKLAAAAGTGVRNKNVALITLDENRIGAIEQLKVYAKIIGIPIKVASCKKEVKKQIETLTGYDLIFIDTPGISQTNQVQFNELKEAFSRIHDVEFHLVLSAATNEKTLRDVIEKFRIFQVSRLIFTKLDESISYGGIVNQLYRSKIPVSYFTNGQQVPEDIEAATIEGLADLVFNENKLKKFLSGAPEQLAQNIIKFERILGGYDDEPHSLLNNFENDDRSIRNTSTFGERFSSYRC